jgi:hypothetical protein
VYCHVKDVSVTKSGDAISDDPVDYPVVATGAGWTVLQCLGPAGATATTEYAVGLSDNLYTPGDTVYYYFSARDGNGVTTYWSLPVGATNNQGDVILYPNEVTCLPANALNGATDILYIDNYDNSNAQSYFESAFEALGLTPDRYDNLAIGGERWSGPGLQVISVTNQLISCYKKIIWNSGDFRRGTIKDGSSSSSDDFSMLFEFLDQHPDGAGLYISGNSIAEEWVSSTQPGAMNLRNTYMNFDVLASDHVVASEPVSPLVVGQNGSPFDHPTGADSLYAFGACPITSRFDVLAPTNASELAAAYSNNPAHGAILTQATPNSVGDTARVVLSGFSYHRVRDDVVQSPMERVDHLADILRFLRNDVDDPIGAVNVMSAKNALKQNYPNPCNPTTTIDYSIKERGHVSLQIYDVSGRLVRTLVDEVQEPSHVRPITWDGRSHLGNTVSSGVYFCRLVTKGFTQTNKLLVLK